MSEGESTLGQRLQAGREQKGLTAQQAADTLHLDRWVIDGLESGDHARIGPSVYAKGHLKRYAELLGLPVAEVLAEFDGRPSLPEGPHAPPPTLRMRTSPAAGTRLPWLTIAGFAVAVSIAVGIFWWKHQHRGSALPVAVVHPEAAASAATAGAGGAQTAAEIAPSAVPAASAQVSAEPSAAYGRARLRLSFSGDSWVDVRDASGLRLFAGNGHANNVRSMSGEAPFRVYLKSAASVRLEINNHLVAVGPQYIIGSAARFEAGADGVLRTPAAPASAHPRG